MKRNNDQALPLPPRPFSRPPFFERPRPDIPRTMTSPWNFRFVYALACSSSTSSSTNVRLRGIAVTAFEAELVEGRICPSCHSFVSAALRREREQKRTWKNSGMVLLSLAPPL